MAKDTSWKKYGEELSKLYKKLMGKFCRSMKAMRRTLQSNCCSNDNEGNPLYDDKEIKWRWGEYFKDLLNPIGHSYMQTCTHVTTHLEQEEPNIAEEEVQMAVRSSPKYKAAGMDCITTEAINSYRETGIKWLTLIFQKALEERCVPGDWQRAILVPIWKRKGRKERL